MRFTLLILLLLAPVLAFAQNQHAVRVGINRAFFGTGDVVGPAMYAEYSYQVSPYVAIAPRILSGMASRQTQNNFDQISSFAANVSVRITPLPQYVKWFSLDVGGLYHRFANTYGNTFGTFGSAEAFHNRDHLWGGIAAVNTDWVHQENFTVGSRLEMLTSFGGGFINADSFQIGVYYSRRF